MMLNDFAADRQPQSGAAGMVGSLYERLEYTGLIGLGDTAAGVGDFQPEPLTLTPRPQLDTAAAGGMP
jgi:hypothetical protein